MADEWIEAAASHMLKRYALDIFELYDKDDLQDFRGSFANPLEFVQWFAHKHDLDPIQTKLARRGR